MSKRLTRASLLQQARLPEIGELEKQIKATNEELADVQYKAREDAATAAATEEALQEQLEQAKAQVRTLGQEEISVSCTLFSICLNADAMLVLAMKLSVQ